MSASSEHLQDRARAAWRREVELHIPGLKVSNLPCWFAVPLRMDGGVETTRPITVGWFEFVTRREKWAEIPDVLEHVARVFDSTWALPKGWSYEQLAALVAPDEIFEGWDLPNPRLYALDGSPVPTRTAEGAMALDLRRRFLEMLGVLWQYEPEVLPPQPFNARREHIYKLLDHHHGGGGNAQSFRDFISEVARSPASIPPPPTANNTLTAVITGTLSPLRDPDGLAVVLGDWLAVIRSGGQLLDTSEPFPPTEGLARKKAQAVPVRTLQERFRNPAHYARFMRLLQEHDIIDAGGAYIAGDRKKGRLWGAYEGAGKNPLCGVITGPFPEMVETLNEAFPDYRLSPARPQDLRGTAAHAAMLGVFQSASFPL